MAGYLLFLIFFVTKTKGQVMPSFLQAPRDQTGISGGVCSFVCQATGEPRPHITWMKNGKNISSQRIEVMDFDEGSGSVLRIQPLRTLRDEAVYECTASNSVGQVKASARLTVLKEDQISYGFPIIEMGPQLKVVERTRTATMLCVASGHPDPEIHWIKDFVPLDISSSDSRVKQLPSGALQIENSQESDQGKYECVATNNAGTRYSSPANLYVRVRRTPPRFSTLPSHHEVMPGGSVNLTCVAVGSPMPYVKWMSGWVELTPEEEMPVGRNVLEITHIHQSAIYTCVAMSSLGVIEATAQITVKDVINKIIANQPHVTTASVKTTDTRHVTESTTKASSLVYLVSDLNVLFTTTTTSSTSTVVTTPTTQTTSGSLTWHLLIVLVRAVVAFIILFTLALFCSRQSHYKCHFRGSQRTEGHHDYVNTQDPNCGAIPLTEVNSLITSEPAAPSTVYCLPDSVSVNREELQDEDEDEARQI